MDPTSAATMDLLAEVEMSVGEAERAQRCWMRGIEISEDPDSVENTERWLYIAQMQEGDAARTSYMQGIALLNKRLQVPRPPRAAEEYSALNEGDSPDVVRAKLCTAQCALADLYLTDLCFEDGAEEKCQAALDAAAEHNVAQSHEPLQSMASLRFSQGKPDEASQVRLSLGTAVSATQAEEKKAVDLSAAMSIIFLSVVQQLIILSCVRRCCS
jgi:hypothetical protein